ncbi:ATP-binding protein [Streptomyces sp. ODS28]|uniref:ATP-binding protein n=1 Tax=Streptomyces sp. ODS28 TaxID=3136688 RepID=UPI0031EB5B49
MSQADTLNHHSRPATATQTAYLHSSAQSRQIARGYLAVLSPPPTPETVDRVLLVVSELVTNALQHTEGVTGFSLSTSAHELHVAVSDASSALPHERTPDLSSTSGETGGFGWPLVRHFAREVTIQLGAGHTKTIRATLPL